MGINWDKRKEEIDNTFENEISGWINSKGNFLDEIITQEKIIAKRYYDIGKNNNKVERNGETKNGNNIF